MLELLPSSKTHLLHVKIYGGYNVFLYNHSFESIVNTYTIGMYGTTFDR